MHMSTESGIEIKVEIKVEHVSENEEYEGASDIDMSPDPVKEEIKIENDVETDFYELTDDVIKEETVIQTVVQTAYCPEGSCLQTGSDISTTPAPALGMDALESWAPDAPQLLEETSSELVEVFRDPKAGAYFGQSISTNIQRDVPAVPKKPKTESVKAQVKPQKGKKQMVIIKNKKSSTNIKKRCRNIRTHTGSKSYSRNKCDNKFYNKENIAHLLDHSYSIKIHNDHTYCKLQPQTSTSTDVPVPEKTKLETTDEETGQVKPAKGKKSTNQKKRCPHCTHECDARNMANHIRTHTGEKPYSCPKCDYRSADKGNLSKHLKGHAKVKPLKCSFCNDYTCIEKNRLVQHIRTHTGETPFSCSLCGKRLKTRDTLARHLKLHSSELYKCDTCGYETKIKGNLTKHTKCKGHL